MNVEWAKVCNIAHDDVLKSPTWQMRVELRVQYSCVINSTLLWQPNFTWSGQRLTVQLGGTLQNEGNSGYSYNY